MLLFDDCRYVVITNTLGRINRFKSYWWNGASCKDSIAYITHYPCIICTRLLLASGVKVIKYINDYNNDTLVNIHQINNKKGKE